MITHWAVPLAGIDPSRVSLTHLHAVASGLADQQHWASPKPWAARPPRFLDGLPVLEITTLTTDSADQLRASVAPGTAIRFGSQHGTALAAPHPLTATTWTDLHRETPTEPSWTVRFRTPATFGNGNRFSPWPDPAAVARSLTTRWNTFNPDPTQHFDEDPRLWRRIWVSDVADDHTVEVFHGHYAHGTTLHVIAANVITAAQQRWFSEAITGPTVLTTDAEPSLAHPDAPAALGLTTRQIDELRSGALDMGISSCRDPFDSPFGRSGQVCPVAPLRCLECRHALILPSNLPQLLLLSDHLHRLRNRLSPRHFHELWGQSAANLAAVLAERSDAEIAVARKQIALGEASLHLPMASRTEFDR